MRRWSGATSESLLHDAEAARQARWKGSLLNLTEHELQLLAALAEDPGRAWTFAGLYERVWGTRYLGDDEPVRSAVKRLRKKLSGAGVTVVIQAVRGVGFRLASPKDPQTTRRPPH